MRHCILLLGPYPPPEHGTSIPFRYLVEYLRRNGEPDVIVVNTESGDKSSAALFSLLTARSFLSVSFELLRKGVLCDKFVIYGSQRFIATAGALYTILLSLLGKEICIYVQGGAFDVYYASRSYLTRKLMRLCLGRARSLAVQTHLVHDMLVGHFRNVVVVPNWTHVSSTVSISPKTRAEQSGVYTGFRFVFVGEVRSEKGVAIMVDAFGAAQKMLASYTISISLDIYGPVRAEFRDVLQPLLDRYSDLVHYHGPVEHYTLMGILSQYDALVLPTQFPSEGYPGVIIEAMSLGIPVIASRFRAIPEIVNEGITGLLCEPGDVNSLRDCVVKMASNNEDRQRMGVAAKKAAARFDIGVVIPELCRVYGIPLESCSADVG